MPWCCAPLCSNSYKKGYTMKKFPKDAARRELWRLQLKKPNFFPSNFSTLCEMHFDENDWVVKNGRRSKLLKPDAIPKIFSDKDNLRKRKSPFKRSSPLKPPTPKRRRTPIGNQYLRKYHGYAKQITSPMVFSPDSPQVTYSPSPGPSLNMAPKELSLTANQSPTALPSPPAITITLEHVDTLTPVSNENSITPAADAETFHLPKNPNSIPFPANADTLTCLPANENSVPLPVDTQTLTPAPKQILAPQPQTASTSAKGKTPKQRRALVKLQSRYSQLNRLIMQLRSKVVKLEKELLASKASHVNTIFNEDQLKFLRPNTKKMKKWSLPTLMTGFRLKFTCGTTGYQELLKLGYPLPSIRTLSRHLEHIKFESGILHEVFDRLPNKINAMNENEKDCVLTLDEMALTPATEYDVSSGTLTGEVTLPSHTGVATHALTFMLGGISSRWKQTVAYYFTGDSTDGAVLKEIILNIILLAENLTLKVHLVTTDMGSLNLGMWKVFGVSCNRNSVINSIEHPLDPSRRLIFCPDVPHILKNIRKSFITHGSFLISEDIVDQHQLPSDRVELHHVKLLCDHQQDQELKLAPHLRPSSINSNHFDKMKVSVAYHLLNKEVGNALKYLVEEEGYDKNLLTTSWFLNTIHHWFELMTSRNPTMALSHMNEEKYEESIQFLHLVKEIFQKIKFGSDARWKPIQTGVIMSTTSILELQKYFLDERNYIFLLTSRFTQDCLENLFSTVRSRQPIPTPLQFKRHLKVITISQYMRNTCNSSYNEDDREFLGDFFKQSESTSLKISQEEEEELQEFLPMVQANQQTICRSELNSLYNLAGYLLFKIKSNNKVCDNCYDSLILNDNNNMEHAGLAQASDENNNVESAGLVQGNVENNNVEHAGLVQAKEFKKGCLVHVNEKCFRLVRTLEETFRGSQMIFPECKDKKAFLTTLLGSAIEHIDILTCHNIKKKIIDRFLALRLRIYASFHTNVPQNRVDYGSKSVCMRAIAKNLKCKKKLF